MESEEIRELRATLLKLKQEHRDLDSAINALEESGRADQLQLKRLKKKKLFLKDEIARIDREMKKVEKDVAGLEKRLASSGFVDRAPPEVVEEARKQLASLLEARTRLGEARKLAEEL